MSRILGLDPGSLLSGYGILEHFDSSLSYQSHGLLQSQSKQGFAQKITTIGQQLRLLLADQRPDVVVVEKIFLGKNADSAFKLGHIRGICLYEASQCGCQVVEYAARSVKKGVTGSGAASKEHVRMVVKNLLRIPGEIAIDASDALALAIHHAQQERIEKKIRLRGNLL